MTSKIDLFIYEVVGPEDINKQYFFSGIKKKTKINNVNSNVNSYIKANYFEPKSNRDKYYYTKNILINKYVNPKNIYTQEIIQNIYTQEIIQSNNKDKIDDFFHIFNILYKLYLKYPARLIFREMDTTIKSSANFDERRNNILFLAKNEQLNLSKNIYREMSNLIHYNTISLKNQFYDIKGQTNQIIKNINDNSEIIYYMNTNKKIIVIGDIHGSFHSFFRIILRFYIKGIIKKDFELDNNYKIIFLGNVIDIGYYSIEVLYIILRLMKKNNLRDGGILNVILIRGNHEEEDTYKKYTFEREEDKKHTPSVTDFLKYCPSAIRLTHNNTVYWLCHGGFSIGIEKNKYSVKSIKYITLKDEKLVEYYISILKKTNKVLNTEIQRIYLNNIDNSVYSQIRWNNFSLDAFSRNRVRDTTDDTFEIGYTVLLEFKEMMKIDFIIKGNDNHENKEDKTKIRDYKKRKSNAFLRIVDIKDNSTEGIFDLNLKVNDDVKTQLNKFIEYKPLIEIKKTETIKTETIKTENEILSIYPKKFMIGKNNKNINIIIDNKTKKILPVLTISNNCDNKRDLYSDSYIIINNE